MNNPFDSQFNHNQDTSRQTNPAQPQQSYPGQSANYGANPPYTPAQPQQPAQTAYTWSPRQSVPYYSQPPVPPKKPKKHKGRFALKLLAAVLACAVVSLGSVGVFAALIVNGVVSVESPSGVSDTAAITLYKKDTDSSAGGAASTVTIDEETPQEIAKALIPSVVCVQNYQVSQSYGFFFGYGNDASDGELSPAGEGSGIIISDDGYIVTNQHVVDGATSLKVVTSEGLTYEAELVGPDRPGGDQDRHRGRAEPGGIRFLLRPAGAG